MPSRDIQVGYVEHIVPILRRIGALELAAWGVLQSDYTLTSQTAAQKLFDFSTNGALSLALGMYDFSCIIHLTGMSATSDNAAFSLLGAGTAVLQTSPPLLYSVAGLDNNTPLNTTNVTGSISNSETSNSAMVTATIGSGLAAAIRGRFAVTTAGTIIPSIALATAAAAVVKAGSYFACQRIGPHNVATQGSWS